MKTLNSLEHFYIRIQRSFIIFATVDCTIGFSHSTHCLKFQLLGSRIILILLTGINLIEIRIRNDELLYSKLR